MTDKDTSPEKPKPPLDPEKFAAVRAAMTKNALILQKIRAERASNAAATQGVTREDMRNLSEEGVGLNEATLLRAEQRAAKTRGLDELEPPRGEA